MAITTCISHITTPFCKGEYKGVDTEEDDQGCQSYYLGPVEELLQLPQLLVSENLLHACLLSTLLLPNPSWAPVTASGAFVKSANIPWDLRDNWETYSAWKDCSISSISSRVSSCCTSSTRLSSGQLCPRDSLHGNGFSDSSSMKVRKYRKVAMGDVRQFDTTPSALEPKTSKSTAPQPRSVIKAMGNLFENFSKWMTHQSTKAHIMVICSHNSSWKPCVFHGP